MLVSNCFVWAMHHPEVEDRVKGLLDSDLEGRDLRDFHTLIVEKRYGKADVVDRDHDGIVLILLSDEDESHYDRRVLLGVGSWHLMSEALRQLSNRIDFVHETDSAPQCYSEMDAELQQHVLNNQAPIEWHTPAEGETEEDHKRFLDAHLFAIGLNGNTPRAPKCSLGFGENCREY